MNQIEIKESVYKKNEETAAELNAWFTEKGIFAVNVMGAPGVGKTSALINILPKLSRKSFVIEGDIESDIDTKKLLEAGVETVQINTGGACHLDAPQIEKAVGKLPLEKGFLFIENIGNLVCPAEFSIGEHIKMLITSVAEGSDKPYKYPLAFEKADILIINKLDLLEYVDFDEQFFMEGVKKLNPRIAVFRVSCKNGQGFDEAVEWILQRSDCVINRL